MIQNRIVSGDTGRRYRTERRKNYGKCTESGFFAALQSEIDTLIEFISDKREAVDSSVLNQASIDKLLEMLRFNDGRAKNEEILTIGEVSGHLQNS